ncbi:MAG: CDP-diacylglycerol--glycerol-3-phosphate 3-phosphatidyltransferase [Desulfovibrio sp.]|uniref:CDP-diacylglycerol--glycerol-3-phosphate 3-phosphatidyltransferase n=1 Tax=Desulfovibrio sp. 7SRBS1 TaxID=3378064 RepID=UPI003B3C719B
MFNLANKLTLLRIIAVPILVLLLYFPGVLTSWGALLVFAAAALTDLFDGMVARRQKLVTNIGKFLDPLADKLLICSVLIMLVNNGWAPAWVVILIMGRELAVTGMRAVAADQGIVIAADKFGKLKTVLQIFALCPLILHYPVFGWDPQPLGIVVLYLALFMTVVSGGKYMYNFYRTWSDSAE